MTFVEKLIANLPNNTGNSNDKKVLYGKAFTDC
jgi:hypothetical protein